MVRLAFMLQLQRSCCWGTQAVGWRAWLQARWGSTSRILHRYRKPFDIPMSKYQHVCLDKCETYLFDLFLLLSHSRSFPLLHRFFAVDRPCRPCSSHQSRLCSSLINSRLFNVHGCEPQITGRFHLCCCSHLWLPEVFTVLSATRGGRRQTARKRFRFPATPHAESGHQRSSATGLQHLLPIFRLLHQLG